MGISMIWINLSVRKYEIGNLQVYSSALLSVIWVYRCIYGNLCHYYLDNRIKKQRKQRKRKYQTVNIGWKMEIVRNNEKENIKLSTSMKDGDSKMKEIAIEENGHNNNKTSMHWRRRKTVTQSTRMKPLIERGFMNCKSEKRDLTTCPRRLNVCATKEEDNRKGGEQPKKRSNNRHKTRKKRKTQKWSMRKHEEFCDRQRCQAR